MPRSHSANSWRDTRGISPVRLIANSKFLTMSTRARTPRGTGIDRVQVAFRVSGSTKAKVNRMADALGLSQSQVMELALGQVDVDADGNVWVGDQVLMIDESQEELPLASSA